MLGLPEDAEQPLLIEADSGTYNDDPNGTLELSGNVKLEQGTMRVEAAQVTATKRDGELFRVVATGTDGEPAQFRLRRGPDEPFVRGHAQAVDYGISEQRASLSGNAFLSAGVREYRGGTIVWDMKEDRVDCQVGCRYHETEPSPQPPPTPD